MKRAFLCHQIIMGLLSISMLFPLTASADVYESSGILGDLTVSEGETITINTGATPPTFFVEAFPIGALFSGRVDNGLAVFDFNDVYIPSGVPVTVIGNRPLVVAAKGDMFIGSSFNVSSGIAGGGAGGAGGAGSAGGVGGVGGGGGTGGAGGAGGKGGDVNPASNPGEAGLPGSGGNNGQSGNAGSNGINNTAVSGGQGAAGFGNPDEFGGAGGAGGSGGGGGTGSTAVGSGGNAGTKVGSGGTLVHITWPVEADYGLAGGSPGLLSSGNYPGDGGAPGSSNAATGGSGGSGSSGQDGTFSVDANSLLAAVVAGPVFDVRDKRLE
ncbi:MAG TPA: hypothetical protein PLI09_23490, partial [Candidatus Hydrogenedentes bacterium]|nr:hypothetical protein [Candidatus Hydrogenedentota bacterium]